MKFKKNRDIAGGKEFWDHVEKVAAEAKTKPELRNFRQAPVAGESAGLASDLCKHCGDPIRVNLCSATGYEHLETRLIACRGDKTSAFPIEQSAGLVDYKKFHSAASGF